MTRTLKFTRPRGCFPVIAVAAAASVFALSSSSSTNAGPASGQVYAQGSATPSAADSPPPQVMPAVKPETVAVPAEKDVGVSPAAPGAGAAPAAPETAAAPTAPQTAPAPAAPETAAMPAAPETAAASFEPKSRFVDEVSQYLWSVYQRSSTKHDSRGDFTWKDAAAAARFGLSTQDYVIGGMDADFRELLFHAGQAMDEAGIDWTILSAFRDDFRQKLAVGFKAHEGNSFHGGSVATGGYGHGCAIDLASAEAGLSNDIVGKWLDQHGEPFGLRRPLAGIDPAHVQANGPWHDIAITLRNDRLENRPPQMASNVSAADPAEPIPVALDDASPAVSSEQFNCIRPRPLEQVVLKLVNHLKRFVARAPVSGAEKSLKGRWRAAETAAVHRVTFRRQPAKAPRPRA